MALNFKIDIDRNSNKLHLKLRGDFDGMSACELLIVLRKNCEGVASVFIDTSGLKEIYPFGQDTFRNNLHRLKDRKFRLVFTGQNAGSIAPERSRSF
ncbi:MAG: hypothetical protein JRI58_12900 [Deltaproteobacteria bacterium]|nr:hypothetical protein [Deltaproteobacteria bacterium]MBW2075622.1 hypothetical protein [Deltaproteobacteria bacterium]